MNVGSLLAGLSLDKLREIFTENISFSFIGMELLTRPTQMIFFVAVQTTLVSLVLVIFCIRSRIPKEAYKEGEESKAKEDEATVEQSEKKAEPPKKKKQSPIEVMMDVFSEKIFWIFIVFTFLLVLVKMIFQYNHSLYPLYMERIDIKLWTGRLYAINPLIVIFLVPVMTAVTSRMRGYTVIMVGSFIAAGSVFFLELGEAITYIILFQVVLSLGEAIYSPKVYDYTANIAPPVREASYMAYSKAPMFFAKVAAGPATGWLLASMCPGKRARGTRNSCGSSWAPRP